MKLHIIVFSLLPFISFSQQPIEQEVEVRDATSYVSLDPKYDRMCEGDILTFSLSSNNDHVQRLGGIAPRNYYVKFYDYDSRYNVCSFAFDHQEKNYSITWSGPNILGKQEDVYRDISNDANDNAFVSSTIKVSPTTSTTYTFQWDDTTIYPATQCKPAHRFTYRYIGTFVVTVIPSPNKPILTGRTVSNTPSYLNIPYETVLLTAEGCRTTEGVNWSPSDNIKLQSAKVSGDQAYLIVPYDCLDYKASCYAPNCPNLTPKWSDPVKASTSFKPTNAGFNNFYSGYLQRNLAESQGKPEYAYRKQFTCIQQRTADAYRNNPTGWAGGFPKYLFDQMATENPCESSMDYKCLASFLDDACLTELGLIRHVGGELLYGFFSYPAHKLQDLSKWTSDHENFINLAVVPCLNELANDPYFKTGTAWRDAVRIWAIQESTIGSVRYIREKAQLIKLPNIFWNEAQEVLKSLGNDLSAALPKIRLLLPQPRLKEDIISSDIDAASINRVTINSNQYLVKPNQPYSVIITPKTGNGGRKTAALNSIEYALSVDSDIATIDANGVLIVHKMPLPTTNDRFPILVFVKSGQDYSVGQFAIYDNDQDGDQLNDTYESAIGLNPTDRNDGLSDLDGDNLLDQYEALLGTSPLLSDSDGDGYSDLFEVLHNTNPMNLNSVPQYIQSTANGLWSNSATWSCGCVPTATDDVRIKGGHTIIIDNNSANANSILMEGRIEFIPGAKINVSRP